MSVEITRSRCGKGIALTKIYDGKFKSFSAGIRMTVPMDAVNVPLYMLATDIITTSNKKYPAKEELSKALLELYDASIGSGASRIGDHCVLEVSLNCICDRYTIDGERVAEKAAGVLMDCLLEPYLENGAFCEKYFRLCRDEYVDDINTIINSKRRYAGMLSKKLIFEGELSAITAYDYLDTLNAADPAVVTEAYRRLLKTAYIDIYVSGGECDDGVIGLIADRLKALERKEMEQPEYSSVSPLKQEVKRCEITAEAKQTQLIMAYKTENYNEYASKLFGLMFGGSPTSKLFMNVREKQSLCYSVSAVISEVKSTLTVTAGIDHASLGQVEEAVAEQLRALQEGDFTDEELENSKKYLSEAYLSNYDSKYDLVTWYFFQSVRGTDDTPEEKGRRVRAVTREQLIAEARGYKLDSVFVMKAIDGGDDDEA